MKYTIYDRYSLTFVLNRPWSFAYTFFYYKSDWNQMLFIDVKLKFKDFFPLIGRTIAEGKIYGQTDIPNMKNTVYWSTHAIVSSFTPPCILQIPWQSKVDVNQEIFTYGTNIKRNRMRFQIQRSLLVVGKVKGLIIVPFIEWLDVAERWIGSIWWSLRATE